eukprot:3271256-Rhodomonas_salina.1
MLGRESANIFQHEVIMMHIPGYPIPGYPGTRVPRRCAKPMQALGGRRAAKKKLNFRPKTVQKRGGQRKSTTR